MKANVLALILVMLQTSACLCLSVPACSGADEITAINARISADSKNSDLYLKRAALKLKYLDYEACIADLNRSIELKPTADKYFMRAMARREVGKLADAELDFEKSAQLDPSSQSAFAELACLAAKLRHYEKAKKGFDGLFKLNPGRLVERSRRAEMYLQMKKPQDALIDIQAVLKKDKDSGGRCHSLLGQACLQLHQYDKAAEAFSYAIRKNEFNFEARKGRAEAYEKLGKTKLAQQDRRELEEDFSEAFHNAPFRAK